MEKILITGASGFIARNLIPILHEAEYKEIVAITSSPDELVRKYNSQRIKAYTRKAISTDSSIFDGVDILLHCGFPMGGKGDDIANALNFTASVMNGAVTHNVKKIINMSSQRVYDKFRDHYATETSLIKPDSMYGLGKYASEVITASICNGYNYINVRMSSLIGRTLEQRITNKLVRKAVQGQKLQVIKNNQKFGFMDVRDACSAIVALMDYKSNIHLENIYNIGTNTVYELPQIAESIKRISQEFDVNVDISVEGARESGQADTNSSVDASKFKRDFNWKPEHGLDDTIRDIFSYVINETVI